MIADELLAHCADGLRKAGLSPERRLLLAFSGGLDSSVLLDLLHRHTDRGGPPLELVHIDHNLRDDSRNDADFCTAEAKRRGLPIATERLTWKSRDVGQAAARKRRMAAIADVAFERGIDDIAFAHHGDDRFETFLFNLRRGTGLDGLAPMALTAPFPLPGADLRIIRPVLGIFRAQLESYADARGVEFVTDPTNIEDGYSRNRIRHHLVPQLVSGDDEHRSAVLDAIDHLASERRAATHYARALADEAAIDWPGLRCRAFDRIALAKAPAATVARLFHILEPSLNAAAIGRIHNNLSAPPSAAPRHLTLSRCVITFVGDRIVFYHSTGRGGKDVLERQAEPILLTPFDGGQAPYFGSEIHWGLERSDAEAGHHRWEARFDADALARPLRLGGFEAGARLTRSDGDEIYHQKLTKLFSASGVDADIRWRWPCIYDAHDHLVWAAGLERGAAASVEAETVQVWNIRVTPSLCISEFIQQ